MQTRKYRLVAALTAVGLLAAPAAHADWRDHHGGWHGDYGRHGYYRHDGGNAAAGALVGLGIGALIGGVIASQSQYYAPPPAYYAPPPAYYAAPVYAPPPAYYSGY